MDVEDLVLLIVQVHVLEIVTVTAPGRKEKWLEDLLEEVDPDIDEWYKKKKK